MLSTRMKICALLCVAVLCGCASAEKRFEQGTEAAAKGQFEDAVVRYVQALEKDPSLDAARDRLVWVGDLAIEERLEDCDLLMGRNDPAGAASHLHRIDGVVSRARSVGVKLGVPADYEPMRRGVFDDAFEAVMTSGEYAARQGRWPDALDDFRRARHDFEPSAEQNTRSFTAEAAALADWSEAEYEMGHLRGAFDVAAQVSAMPWSPAAEAGRAASLMDAALAAGEIELIILPVQPPSTKKKTDRRQPRITERLHEPLEVALSSGPWRTPPPFIRLHEALAARDLITRAGVLDSDYNSAAMALILRLAESDFAVHLQVVQEGTTEFNVRTRSETTKTKDGKPATFTRESGTRRCQATVRVVMADEFGNELADMEVDGGGEATFERGVYDGDPRKLNLSSRQVDLFDKFELERQEAAALEALITSLATGIADAVYGAALDQVP